MCMKRILVLTFSIITFSLVRAQSPEQAVLDLSERKFNWMIRMHYDSLESVLDDRVMFIHSNGWTETKSELIADLKSGKLRYVAIEVIESSARLYSNSAIVTGKGKFTVVLDGNDLVINLYYTEVYVLKNGNWLLASRHANRLP
jgi:hypothetical protein